MQLAVQVGRTVVKSMPRSAYKEMDMDEEKDIMAVHQEADKTLRKWKKSNPKLFKKATKILLDIMMHPRTGLGHPEPLVGGNDVTYSRHITAHGRIIYDNSVTVLIVQAEQHYNDK